MKIDIHPRSVELGQTSPQHAGLADFHFNPAVGCSYGCRFCFIGNLYSKSQAEIFLANGISDPAHEHGKYVLIRPLDEPAFVRALERADGKFPDRSGIIAYSTTTDPYMLLPSSFTKKEPEAQAFFDNCIERSLMLVLFKSGLRVRILTRSPSARRHFDLFREFGDRLMFGMSLPTLNPRLANLYEPGAPSPKERLRTLRAAKAAGLHLYASMSPTYPECDEADLTATMEAIAALNPVTVFHEPVNFRENMRARLSPNFPATGSDWTTYALRQFGLVHKIAVRLGLGGRLHLLPDDLLERSDPAWYNYWRKKVTAWPQSDYA